MSNRIPPVPSSITGDLARYLGLVIRQLNSEQYVSRFSGVSPNTSAITGIPGDLTVNIGSAADTYRLWSKSGSTMRATQANWVELGAGSGAAMSGVRVIGAGVHPVGSDAVYSYVTWDTEDYDVGGYHSTTSARITIPASGYYRYFGCLDWPSSVTGLRFMAILKNRDTATPLAQDGRSAVSSNPAKGTQGHCYGESHLNATDFIEIAAYQTSGSTLSIARATSWFGASLIAAD